MKHLFITNSDIWSVWNLIYYTTQSKVGGWGNNLLVAPGLCPTLTTLNQMKPDPGADSKQLIKLASSGGAISRDN